MERRIFGGTGLSVSVLGYGAGAIGSDSISEADSARLLNSILDEGINVIDTARSYGLSEERIGRHLKHRRSEFVLSTKIGYGIEGIADWTPAIITAGVDRALRVLQRDVIDIVHLHSCPLTVLKQEGIVETLLRTIEAGKVRVAAYSGDNEAFDWALESNQFGALQTSINICDQRAIPFLAIAQDRGIGILAKRSLANAPWRDGFVSPEDNAAVEYKHRWNQMRLQLDPTTAAEIALRFVAYLPAVGSCLVGSSKLNHIVENIKMVERGPLSPDIVQHIRSGFTRHGADWPGQI